MLLYLDLNCFNRPFDDQSQDRIAQETTAVLSILQRIIDGVDLLAWSAVLDFENTQHPLVDRRTEIGRWAQRAEHCVSPTPLPIWRNELMTDSLADDALCAKGLALLEDQLGLVQTLRFLALLSRQPFDYQHWRQQHFAGMSLSEVLTRAHETSIPPLQNEQ